jgi:hypothetical protein
LIGRDPTHALKSRVINREKPQFNWSPAHPAILLQAAIVHTDVSPQLVHDNFGGMNVFLKDKAIKLSMLWELVKCLSLLDAAA